jgi:hypothetical protein
MMFCSGCGKLNSDYSACCKRCGKRLVPAEHNWRMSIWITVPIIIVAMLILAWFRVGATSVSGPAVPLVP